MVPLFAITILAGAALIFIVEPMAAKSILPLLGGSPAVWNTAMVFFQAGLLAGYAGAHILSRIRARVQVSLYALMLTVPIATSIVLRRTALDLPSGWVPPVNSFPVSWALALLSAMVGAPFVVLSAAGPMLQSWFGRTGHRRSADPYFLYVASNLGSMLGLLAYPFAVEPLFTLSDQRRLWSIGFDGFAVLAAACGVVMLLRSTRAPASGPSGAGGAASERVPGSRRLLWLVLALIPSSLMLGVTQYLSTDIAAVPLLWVLPLAIYLLTLIIAFTRTPLISSTSAGRLLPVVMVALAIAFIVRGYHLPTWALFALHLLGLFVIGLYCHARLAEIRPGSMRLTEFYLIVALGGVLGGVFNAVIAPLIFPLVIEYPLMVFLASLLRIGATAEAPSPDESRDPPETGIAKSDQRPSLAIDLTLDASVALLTGSLIFGLTRLSLHVPRVPDAVLHLALAVGVPGFVLYLSKHRPVRFAMALGAVLAASYIVPEQQSHTIYLTRTFFGVYRVERSAVDTRLSHGTTLHGMQWLDPERAKIPASYYHPAGPIGQVFRTYGQTPLCDRVGLIGLGSGALAAYIRPHQHFTFHEIDPMMVRIAENPALFTYLRDARRTPDAVIDCAMGDGRLTLSEVPDNTYGLLVLDAFSSDSIPVHLLTREAMTLYFRKLRPGGLAAFHVSNQYLDLAPVIGRIAADLGLACLEQYDQVSTDTMVREGHYESTWVVVARTPGDLSPLAADQRWEPPNVTPRTPLWTDNYSNILGVLGARDR